MKWARVRAKSNNNNPKDKGTDQDTRNDEACFVFYPDQKTLEKEMEQSKNTWADYEFKFHFHKPVQENYEKFQRRYEAHCGGWLLFYDNFLRSKAVDHVIHFKWSPEKATDEGKYRVKIFITPPPQKPIKGQVKKDDKADQNKKQLTGGVYQNVTTADGEDSFSVDPPPPPPPPPPTMH